MAEYVKFEVPAELSGKQASVIEKAAKSGKIRIGSNEVTKAVERGEAKLVVIAGDVEPPEIVMHLPVLCGERKIQYSYMPTKKELGEKAGVKVGTAAIAIVDEGEQKKDFEDLVKKLGEVAK